MVSLPLFLYPSPTCLFVFCSLIPYCQPFQSPLLWAFSVTQGHPPISGLIIASHVGTCGFHWHVGDISSSHGSLWEHCLAAMLISKVLVTLVLQTMAVMAPEDGCRNAARDPVGIVNWTDSDFKKTVLRFIEALSISVWVKWQGSVLLLAWILQRIQCPWLWL